MTRRRTVVKEQRSLSLAKKFKILDLQPSTGPENFWPDEFFTFPFTQTVQILLQVAVLSAVQNLHGTACSV